jgi:hypothetical protein
VDGVRGESHRWQGPKSSFPWEQEALDYIRGLMPDAKPYRAWQTFTFTAASGHAFGGDAGEQPVPMTVNRLADRLLADRWLGHPKAHGPVGRPPGGFPLGPPVA